MFTRTVRVLPSSRLAGDKPMLPESLKVPLQDHMKKAKTIHVKNLAEGWGQVLLPGALDRKYPNAPSKWRWIRVFPQAMW
ncbi:MAG: hypothetical protein Q7J12_02875 [Syntrophales bacterium]|nr:hypothetical protein [Syntrophales bacterium]